MGGLKTIKGVDLFKDMEMYEAVLIGVNICNTMNDGLQYKVRRKYPNVTNLLKRHNYGDMGALGTRYTASTPSGLLISLCHIAYGVHGAFARNLDYGALRTCLTTAAAEFRHKRIACPILGSTKMDGRGDKDKCFNLIKETLQGLDVTIYDYEPLDRVREQRLARSEYANKFKGVEGAPSLAEYMAALCIWSPEDEIDRNEILNAHLIR